MKKLRAYTQVFLIAVREDSTNPKRLMSAIAQMIARVLLVVAIYRVAYHVGGNHVLSFNNAMWTVGLCFVFFLNLGIRNLYKPVELDIKTGVVETALIRPLDWRLVKFIQLLGKNGVEFLAQLVILPLILLATVGPPDASHITPLIGLVFAIFLVLSIITAGALFMTVGLVTFWLNEAQPVFRIVDKMALICCGTFVPLALMPDLMQQIVRFTPFNIYAAPTRLFDPTAVAVIVPTLISGVIWTIIMLGFCQFVWHRAGKRMEVNGG